MQIWLHKLEVFIDKVIPPLLVLLLFLILGELFFHERLMPILAYTDYFDGLIVSVFAIDLAFKFHRVRKVPKFVRKYWLEIIATIPFFLIFRITEFFGLQEIVERSQIIAHEAPEISRLERETSAIVKEAGKIGRTARFLRTMRIVARFPRFLQAVPFFEKPTGRHHWYENKRKLQRQKI
jgi:hypothetical protein